MTIPNQIRNARKSAGLSQSQLATAIGIKSGKGLVSNWETGNKVPSNKQLKAIAKACGCKYHPPRIETPIK